MPKGSFFFKFSSRIINYIYDCRFTRMKRLLFISICFLLCACQKDSETAWEMIEIPSTEESKFSSLSVTQDRELILSWLSGDQDQASFAMCSYAQGKWSSLREIASGEDWFVNWADFPSVASFGKHLAAHYLVKRSEDTYAYDIYVKLSADQGQSWSDAQILHKDGTAAEHGFVSKTAINDSTLGIVWLDGRAYADSTTPNQMSIRYTQISSNGTIAASTLLDNRTCDCCQTDITMMGDQPLVVYRDRRAEEIRDIALVQASGTTWTVPQTVSNDAWEIAGCPVNGPAIASHGQQVAIAWFTAANEKPEVAIRFSVDGGATFLPVIGLNQGKPIGRVDVTFDEAGSAWVSWLEETTEGQSKLLLRKIQADGGMGDPISMPGLSAERAGGFPRAIYYEKYIWVSWTDISGEKPQVRLAKYPTTISS